MSELEQNDKFDEFWSNVMISSNSCWLWTGEKTKDGYGVFTWGGEWLSHRISYKLIVGQIPKTKPELDHYCKVRNCVNPSHVLPTDRSGNLRTRINSIVKQKRIISTNNKLKDITPFLENGVVGLNLAREYCNKNHNLRFLKVGKDNKLRCIDCIEDNERFDLRQTELSFTHNKENVKELIEQVEIKFGKGSFIGAIKSIGYSVGINCYGKKVCQAQKMIKKLIDDDLLSLHELFLHYGLTITKTKLRKKINEKEVKQDG